MDRYCIPNIQKKLLPKWAPNSSSFIQNFLKGEQAVSNLKSWNFNGGPVTPEELQPDWFWSKCQLFCQPEKGWPSSRFSSESPQPQPQQGSSVEHIQTNIPKLWFHQAEASGVCEGSSQRVLLALSTARVRVFLLTGLPSHTSLALLADIHWLCSQCGRFSFKWPRGCCSSTLMPASSFQLPLKSQHFPSFRLTLDTRSGWRTPSNTFSNTLLKLTNLQQLSHML